MYHLGWLLDSCHPRWCPCFVVKKSMNLAASNSCKWRYHPCSITTDWRLWFGCSLRRSWALVNKLDRTWVDSSIPVTSYSVSFLMNLNLPVTGSCFLQFPEISRNIFVQLHLFYYIVFLNLLSCLCWSNLTIHFWSTSHSPILLNFVCDYVFSMTIQYFNSFGA